MEILNINKNDMKITMQRNSSSNLSDILAWKTTYLNNDFHLVNFDNKSNLMTSYIYFDDKFYKCTINLNGFIIETECIKLKLKLMEIKNNSDNLFSFLEGTSTYLEITNNQHDDYDNSEIIQATELIEPKISNYEWNPYFYLNIKTEYTFNINSLKQNSFQYYEDNSFNCQNLDITKEHVIEVITKELKSIDNKDNFKLVTYDNLFEFDIIFTNFENTQLDDVKMNIKLNPNLYPFYPPSISFKNKLSNNLGYIISSQSYFDPTNWNPTNSLLNMLDQLYDILNKHGTISESINEDFQNLESLIQNIIINNNIKLNSIKEWENISIDYTKISSSSAQTNDSKFWNSGVGYGTSGRTNWDIKKYIEQLKVKIDQELFIIDKLDKEIVSNKDNEDFKSFITSSNLMHIIINYCSIFNIVEIEDDTKFCIYKKIVNIINNLDLTSWDELLEYEMGKISKVLEPFCKEIESYIKLNKNIDWQKKIIFENIIDIYKSFEKYNLTKETKQSNTDEYCNKMRDLQFSESEKSFNKYYYEKDNTSAKPSKLCISKITKELATYNNSLPMNYESSVYVRYDPNNIRNIKALIIGPKDTPYENGCYIFDIFIPNEYPNTAPLVNLQTTGGGSVRFNPNLYNSGKVCLSLLGTWSGNGGEKWNPDTSTLLQVLVSIQSLILVENPYFNEPGYEREMHTENGKRKNFDYNDTRRFWNIKWAINDHLESTCPEFKNVIVNHFKYKKEDIIERINSWYDETKNKSNFNIEKNKCLKLLNEL